MAEREGFEPSMGYEPMLVFKTSAFNRSAISPALVQGWFVQSSWTHETYRRLGHRCKQRRLSAPFVYEPDDVQVLTSFHQDTLSIACTAYPGGERGIRTPAPGKTRPNGLAIRPLQPLGYLSRAGVLYYI